MKIHDLEQRTPEWYAVRCGVPTASNFGKLMTPTGKPSTQIVGYACQLAAEKYAGPGVNTWGGNMDVSRGRILEDDALAWYAFEYGCNPQAVGFVTDDAGTYGCSPDALIGESGMIEIKCLNAENHLKALLAHSETGKAPPDYHAQTQGQLWIAEREWCDLVFYHHNLPPHVIRVYKDAEYIAALQQAVAAVIEKRDQVFRLIAKSSPQGTEKADGHE